MGKVAGLIGNAYTDHHYLSIDQELKPVLAWFNMHIVPWQCVCSSRSDAGRREITDERIRDHLRQLGEAVIRLCHSLQDSPQGPPPLVLWPRKKA